MHEKQIEIRWRDQDAYGHVNNAVYLTYLGVMGLLGRTVADGAGGILGTIAYDVVLTPFVVPLVMAVTRRFAPVRRGL